MEEEEALGGGEGVGLTPRLEACTRDGCFGEEEVEEDVELNEEDTTNEEVTELGEGRRGGERERRREAEERGEE